ncbi:MAG: hypothetical protein FWG97_02025 [Deltaproteobacteria bacterium]|nr:hypothetical protein [Deltaproteobacteria bacterium]
MSFTKTTKCGRPLFARLLLNRRGTAAKAAVPGAAKAAKAAGKGSRRGLELDGSAK